MRELLWKSRVGLQIAKLTCHVPEIRNRNLVSIEGEFKAGAAVEYATIRPDCITNAEVTEAITITDRRRPR